MRKAGIAFPLLIIALTGATIPKQDSRNTSIPDMDTHFQMPVFATRQAWLQKAAFLRMQILSSAGLLPMPEKTPLHEQVFGRLERGTYTVEKVLLETYPGFYLGGNLYRPLGKQGPFPAVVTPHGHWAYGRLENTSQVSIPARCINLARQGFVVFSYDMVGYNDTDQFPHGDSGPHLGGAREDLWSINTMGLQLWNSIRAVDFAKRTGRIRTIAGLAVESSGPAARIGEICEIRSPERRDVALAEVIGFNDGRVLLMPYGELRGIAPDGEVIATGMDPEAPAGAALLGRVIDGFGAAPRSSASKPAYAPSIPSCRWRAASASAFLAAVESAKARCSA